MRIKILMLVSALLTTSGLAANRKPCPVGKPCPVELQTVAVEITPQMLFEDDTFDLLAANPDLRHGYVLVNGALVVLDPERQGNDIFDVPHDVTIRRDCIGGEGPTDSISLNDVGEFFQEGGTSGGFYFEANSAAVLVFYASREDDHFRDCNLELRIAGDGWQGRGYGFTDFAVEDGGADYAVGDIGQFDDNSWYRVLAVEEGAVTSIERVCGIESEEEEDDPFQQGDSYGTNADRFAQSVRDLDQETKTFVLDAGLPENGGDACIALIVVGETFEINGSPNNDGTYTIAAVEYELIEGEGETEARFNVTVEEAIPDDEVGESSAYFGVSGIGSGLTFYVDSVAYTGDISIVVYVTYFEVETTRRPVEEEE